jgi:hypothetical protein
MDDHLRIVLERYGKERGIYYANLARISEAAFMAGLANLRISHKRGGKITLEVAMAYNFLSAVAAAWASSQVHNEINLGLTEDEWAKIEQIDLTGTILKRTMVLNDRKMDDLRAPETPAELEMYQLLEDFRVLSEYAETKDSWFAQPRLSSSYTLS